MKKKVQQFVLIAMLAIFGLSNPGNAQNLVKDIIPGSQSPYPTSFCSNNSSILFFFADDLISGYELWKSDGTAGGTVMVKDIRPGSVGGTSSGGINEMTTMNGNVYFPASDGVNGNELWTSDGTASGTVMVKDIMLNSNGSYPHKLHVMNNVLYFIADDGVNGPELWRSDGTAAGTNLIMDILPGIYGETNTNDASFVEVNGTLYFEARISTSGLPQLWKTTGTASGTVMVKELSWTKYKFLTEFNGKLYFNTSSSVTGEELFVSDGTDAGTFVVKDINPGATGSYPANLTVFNGNLYFIATTAGTGRELWMTDGTSVGTVLIKDINVGTGGMNSPDSKLVSSNGSLFFFAYTATVGSELWKTDGTEAGTVLVKDINPGTNNGIDLNYSNSLISINGVIYFGATNGTNGTELWKSDGTSAGTAMVKDILPNISSSFPDMFYDNGGVLYFTANDGTAGRELWKFDPVIISVTEINFNNLSIHIYPNPFTSQTTITFDQEQKNTTIKIIDVLGKEINTTNFKGKLLTIEKEEMKTGIYFLNIYDGTKMYNQKIVVQ